MSLETRYLEVRSALAQAEKMRTLPCSGTVLVAASKTQPTEVLRQAIALGITHFGENTVQEAAGKWPALREEFPHITLHFIGQLQSNKAAEAVALFNVIHTLDRSKLIHSLAAAMDKQGKRPRLLVQVNTGDEAQKGGVAPRDLPGLLEEAQRTALTVDGLMCVPPTHDYAAPHFALLYKLAREHGLRELSMGMSNDLELAARLGSTMVRVGTRLFGARV